MTTVLPTLILGADHAGFALKAWLADELQAAGYPVQDLGCFDAERVDYPDIAGQVAQTVLDTPGSVGLLCCGSGVGVAIGANRFAGIRAVVAHDETIARLSRQHNDANVLCLGGRFVAPPLAWTIVATWLQTEFEGDRHRARVAMLDTLSC